jgi:hypothetical protein
MYDLRANMRASILLRKDGIVRLAYEDGIHEGIDGVEVSTNCEFQSWVLMCFPAAWD